MIPEKIKLKIDNMDYESLLHKWRFAPVGDPMFSGEVGEYCTKAIKEKRENVGHDAAVAASKRIGW